MSSVYSLAAEIVQAARSGDQILVMSNGAFGGIHEQLLQGLEKSAGVLVAG